MLGTVSVAGGAVLSIYSAKHINKSMIKSEQISNDKKALISGIKKYDQLQSQPVDVKCLLEIDNKTKSGILEILRKKYINYERIILDSEGRIKKINTGTSYEWVEYDTKSVNLNMGLNNFIPPDIEGILYDPSLVTTTNSKNGKTLADALKNSYNIDLSLPENEEYSAEFMSLQGKKIYAYGTVYNATNEWHLNTKNFQAIYMGTHVDSVADKVFKSEQIKNDQNLVMSVFGLTCGISMILLGVSEFMPK